MSMLEGSVFKRCGCREENSGRALGVKCPRLRREDGAWNPRHGNWWFQLELPRTGEGKRRQARRGGLASQDAFLVARAPLAPLGSHTAWDDGGPDRLVATAPTTGADVARLAARALPGDDWRHALVWVARLDELWQKYDDFAVRLAHLDAGVALTHAAVLAAALGSPPRMPASWHAAPFAELLDLTPDTELVTGIMLF
jgi:hypothetical protein